MKFQIVLVFAAAAKAHSKFVTPSRLLQDAKASKSSPKADKNLPKETEASFLSSSQDLGLAQCRDLEEDTYVDPTFYADKQRSWAAADASVRGFEIEAIIGDQLLQLLDGESDPPDGFSEPVEIFRTLVELHNQGVTYSGIPEAMSEEGYDRETILESLSSAPLIRDNFELFMNALAQEEQLEILSAQDEDEVIANSDSEDAFGNAVAIEAPVDSIIKPTSACEFPVTQPASFPGGIGPGFQIRNDTPWPVEVSLWQVRKKYCVIVMSMNNTIITHQIVLFNNRLVLYIGNSFNQDKSLLEPPVPSGSQSRPLSITITRLTSVLGMPFGPLLLLLAALHLQLSVLAPVQPFLQVLLPR